MRLLGVFEKDAEEFLLIQDKNLFFIKELHSVTEQFPNYKLIKNRDTYIGNGKTEGEGVFNFRYGPIMGGVVDAGVFNIYTYGERILSVNIDPSYKKRDIEKHMINKNIASAVRLSESVCSNFAISHSTAFLRAIEDAGNIIIDETTKRIRIVALELERIYNHIYVIARLSKGASQNVLSSHLDGLFEELLRINQLFSNSRFLKNFNNLFIDRNRLSNLDEISLRLKKVKLKFSNLYEHSLESWNYIDRIYKTAALTQKQVLDIGVTGPTLRASDYEEDLRSYEKLYNDFKISTDSNGDSLSRMNVRAKEILTSCDIVENQINAIKNSKQDKDKTINRTISGMGIGYSESPSGLLVYYVEIKDNIIQNVYISTPSVFGFKAFADAFVEYIFTDFSFSFDSFGINFADCAR
jgi:Ni,Fe-hydrogenase III large subunit